jgi:hypothetical protein
MTIHADHVTGQTFETLLEEVSQARYPSGTKVGPKLAHAAAMGMVSPEQVEEIAEVARTRRRQLMVRQGGAAASEPVIQLTEAWTPHQVVDRLHLEETRDADHLEEQMPNGDHEDYLIYHREA